MKLNNISDLSITIPYLDANNYNLDNCTVSKELLKELIEYYNKQIEEHMVKNSKLFEGFDEVLADKNTITIKL